MPDSQIAVVTGAGSGIGAAVAQALGDAGWTVVLAGRRADALAVVAERGSTLYPVPTDVTDEASVRRLFDQIVDRHGRVDLLFNNAGTGAPPSEFDETPLAAWNAVVAVNLTGVFLCSREAATKHAITGLTKSISLDGRPYDIACGQIDIGNAATPMTDRMADGVPQADGTVRPEPRMDVADVARAVLYMAGLPLAANVASMTVMATRMPFIGRG
jgi:NAD(P)-dependent dehydrogenase (short-subunit alcohol dehydrogenase family)